MRRRSAMNRRMDLEIERLVYGTVTLERMAEAHRDQLRAAANADADIWSLYPYSMAGEHFDSFWTKLMARQGAGERLAFAVCLEGICVGISCYLNIEPDQQACDIGGTYYHPAARGGIVNPAAKYLLLGHAFASGARRVAFRIDALNTRSRAAVRKLGAVEEGVLRQNMVTWTGRVRDTVVCSILADEWRAVAGRLEDRLRTRG